MKKVWQLLDLADVEVRGMLGREIDIAIDNLFVDPELDTREVNNSFMRLHLEESFFRYYRERQDGINFIGLGMLIDSAVSFARYTGAPEVIARKDYIIDETLKIQEPDGYIGIMKPEARIWTLWDIHDMGYMITGLVRNYNFYAHDESLEAASKLADHFTTRWLAEPERMPGEGICWDGMSTTGHEFGLLSLYEATGEKRYLDFCVNFRKLNEKRCGIVLGRSEGVQGQAYSFMERALTQIKLHEIQPDPTLFEVAHEIVDFLLNRDGTVVTGACSYRECWDDSQNGGFYLAEHCPQHYQTWLLSQLHCYEPKSIYFDQIERVLYNAIRAGSTTDGTDVYTYNPTVGPRVPMGIETYCCPGNYRRGLSTLASRLYSQTPEGVAVNLYSQSNATFSVGEKKVQISQETRYPSDGNVRITLQPTEPTEFSLRLRIPSWCKEASVAVNGTPDEGPVPVGDYYMIQRCWSPGDEVTIAMPMEWRFIRGRKAQSGRVTVMRGPLVFCLAREDCGESQNRAARHGDSIWDVETLEKVGLHDEDLRELTIRPETLEGPFPDDTVRPDGLCCTVEAWAKTDWYPHQASRAKLTLREFPNPQGEETHFLIADPRSTCITDGELSELKGTEKTPG